MDKVGIQLDIDSKQQQHKETPEEKGEAEGTAKELRAARHTREPTAQEGTTAHTRSGAAACVYKVAKDPRTVIREDKIIATRLQ